MDGDVFEGALLNRFVMRARQQSFALFGTLRRQWVDAIENHASAQRMSLLTRFGQCHVLARAKTNVMGLAVAAIPKNPSAGIPLRYLKIGTVTDGVTPRPGDLGQLLRVRISHAVCRPTN